MHLSFHIPGSSSGNNSMGRSSGDRFEGEVKTMKEALSIVLQYYPDAVVCVNDTNEGQRMLVWASEEEAEVGPSGETAIASILHANENNCEQCGSNEPEGLIKHGSTLVCHHCAAHMD